MRGRRLALTLTLAPLTLTRNPSPNPNPNPRQVREGQKAHRTDAHRQGPQVKGVVHGTITKQLKVTASLTMY